MAMRETNIAAYERLISVNKTGFEGDESFAEVDPMEMAGNEV